MARALQSRMMFTRAALRPALVASAARIVPMRQSLFVRHQSSGSDEGKPMSDADMARVRAAADSVGQKVQEGATALRSAFGQEHGEKVWMTEYYRHQSSQYILPALHLLASDGKGAAVPSMGAKLAVFFAHVLRTLPQDTFPQYSATLTMTPGVDIGLMTGMLHLVGTPAGKLVFERLGASFRRSGNRQLVDMGQAIAAVPVKPVHTWPLPHLDASLADNWKSAVHPWEVTPVFARAKAVVPFNDYLLLSATTVVEALWAAFYATGDKANIRRLLDAAMPWAEYAGMPEAVSYILNVEKPVPEELTRAPEGDTEAAYRSARVQVARVALWSILHHTRRHPAVTEAVAEECGALAEYCAAPDARDPAKAATWSEDDAKARLEVVPALMHLIARTRLDAPFQEELDVKPIKKQ